MTEPDAAAAPVYGKTHCGRIDTWTTGTDGQPVPESCGKPLPCPDHGEERYEAYLAWIDEKLAESVPANA